MRTRVETLLGASLAGSWISTFHALCARLLRREATAIGLPRDFVIYDSSDQVALVKQVLKDLQIDDTVVQPRMALSKISHAKNTMAGPEFFKSQGWSQRGEQLAKVYEKYVQGLRDNGALDFDDLLLKAVELLDKVAHVRDKYAEQFRFVMVDEYQDTNRPQYHLIQRLAERHRNLAVVGDPDQSIYRWRGADLRNILDFEHDFPEARIVKLERNYRSTQVILDAASAVISQNKNRKEKRLWTERKGGDLIKYFRGSDELEEADFIMRTAHSGISSAPDCTVAVLYRTNAQSRVDRRFADALGSVVPCRRRRPLLRTQRNQGLSRLPQAADQPPRRRERAQGDQRACARQRQGRAGCCRSRVGGRSAAAAACERYRRSGAEFAVDEIESGD